MNSQNLIPLERLLIKQRQKAVRRWVLINTVYLMLLVIIGVAYWFWVSGPIDHQRQAGAPSSVEQSTLQLANLRQQSAAMLATLQSVRDVSDRPDWSIFLAALSQRLGDDVVLSGVNTAGDPADTATTAFNTEVRVVQLSGVGRSQQAVTGFVLRLEALKLFSRVQLVQTASQSLRGEESIGFEVVCNLHSPVGGRP